MNFVHHLNNPKIISAAVNVLFSRQCKKKKKKTAHTGLQLTSQMPIVKGHNASGHKNSNRCRLMGEKKRNLIQLSYLLFMSLFLKPLITPHRT